MRSVPITILTSSVLGVLDGSHSVHEHAPSAFFKIPHIGDKFVDRTFYPDFNVTNLGVAMRYISAVLLSIGLVLCAAVGVSTAAEVGTTPYNIPGLTKGTANDIQVKGSLGVTVLMRDANGNAMLDPDGNQIRTKSYPCPGNTTKPCVYVHRFEMVMGSSNRKLYYVHPDKDATQPPGYVITSDFVTPPSITSNSAGWTKGNGSAAPAAPGVPLYTLRPTAIPWSFQYIGSTCVGNAEPNGCQFSPYGLPLNSNVAMMVWSWVHTYDKDLRLDGGGVGRAIFSGGSTFHPSNVKSITTPAFVNGVRQGSVTVRYGSIRAGGGTSLWGWMVTKHTEMLNGVEICKDHMNYAGGTKVSNMLCNTGQPALMQSNRYSVWRQGAEATSANVPQAAQQFYPADSYITSASVNVGSSPDGRVMINIYRDAAQTQLVGSRTVSVVPYGETKAVFEPALSVSPDVPYYLQVIHPTGTYGLLQVYYSFYDDYPNGGAQYNWDSSEFDGPDINARIETAATPPPDTTPPSAPTALTGVAVGGTGAELNWNESSDNFGVARYEIFRNGVLHTTTTDHLITLTGLTCATVYSFQVAAVDAAGNRATSSSFSLTSGACPQAPVVTITSPTANQTLASTTVTMTYTVTNSPTSVTCSLDGAAPAACPSPVSGVGLAQGSHNVVVTATNATGSGSATLNFFVDTVTPETTISSGPANGSTITTVRPTFEFWSNEAGVTYNCWVDSGPATPCTSPHQWALQANGSHSYYVAAKDAAGNVDPTPAVRTFNQSYTDNVAPSAPPGVAVANSTKTTATVSWGAATDNIGVAWYHVYKDSTYVIDFPSTVYSYTLTNLTCGTSYTVNIVSLDAVFNFAVSTTLPFTTQAC